MNAEVELKELKQRIEEEKESKRNSSLKYYEKIALEHNISLSEARRLQTAKSNIKWLANKHPKILVNELKHLNNERKKAMVLDQI